MQRQGLPWFLDPVLLGSQAKKCQDLSCIVLAGRFQLTLIGESDRLAIWSEECRRGHALLEAYTQFLGDVQVRVLFPDVHVYDLEVLRHVFPHGRLVESVVKSPAIGTPVASKNDHQQLVGATGTLPCPLKVRRCVSRWRIRVHGRKRRSNHLRSEEHTSELQSLRHLVC